MIYFLATIQIVILFIGLFLLLRLVGLVVSLWYEVPFVGTPKVVYPEIFKGLKLKKGSTCIDLGSGFGDFCFYLADKGVKARSVEINPILVFMQKVKNRFRRYRIQIQRQDFAEIDLKAVDAVFLYWQPQVIDAHFMNMYEKAEPGTVLLSYFYELPKELSTAQEVIELSNDQKAYRVVKP